MSDLNQVLLGNRPVFDPMIAPAATGRDKLRFLHLPCPGCWGLRYKARVTSLSIESVPCPNCSGTGQVKLSLADYLLYRFAARLHYLLKRYHP